MRPAAALFALALAGAPAIASAQAADPSVAAVEAFHAALVAQMKANASAAKLKPLIEKTFNLPVMASFAVGPAWAGYKEGERKEIAEALGRYVAARFAHEFGAYNGQKFTTSPQVQTRGPDRLVKAEVTEPGEAPVRLGYRLREYGGAWQAIDLYYNGVSELATKRAEFGGAVQGGAAAVVKKLDEAAAKLK